jgi:hypothetical protein
MGVNETRPHSEITTPDLNHSNLVTPYVATMKRETLDKVPGHEAAINTVFDAINEQAITSFSIFHSQEFPGVSFSTIKLSVAPELITKIIGDRQFGQLNEDEPDWSEDSKGKSLVVRDQVWFMEPAMGVGPVGNAFSLLDMGIDRFIREMPKVAWALKHGQEPPNIDIYLLGSPLSFAGTTSSDFIKQITDDGFDAHGKLYTEFLRKSLPTDLSDTRVVITGPSRGSVTAERTRHFFTQGMSEEQKAHVQGLYDIPAGSHDVVTPLKVVKSANLGIGMGIELVARMFGDRTTKDLIKTETPFYEEIKKVKGLHDDSEVQVKQKQKGSLAEFLKLGLGTPPDYNERGYYRSPDFDPTNIKLEGVINRLKGLLTGRRYFLREKGRNLTASTSRKAHNFPWKKSFNRWSHVFNYLEK